jgi:hypothetical protein
LGKRKVQVSPNHPTTNPTNHPTDTHLALVDRELAPLALELLRELRAPADERLPVEPLQRVARGRAAQRGRLGRAQLEVGDLAPHAERVADARDVERRDDGAELAGPVGQRRVGGAPRRDARDPDRVVGRADDARARDRRRAQLRGDEVERPEREYQLPREERPELAGGDARVGLDRGRVERELAAEAGPVGRGGVGRAGRAGGAGQVPRAGRGRGRVGGGGGRAGGRGEARRRPGAARGAVVL